MKPTIKYTRADPGPPGQLCVKSNVLSPGVDGGGCRALGYDLFPELCVFAMVDMCGINMKGSEVKGTWL